VFCSNSRVGFKWNGQRCFKFYVYFTVISLHICLMPLGFGTEELPSLIALICMLHFAACDWSVHELRHTIHGWVCVMYIHGTTPGSKRLLCKIWGIHSSKIQVVVFWLGHCVAAWFMSTNVSGECVASIFMVEMNSGEYMGLENCKQHFRYSVHFQVEFIGCSCLLVID
jgi:hypothetical protein